MAARIAGQGIFVAPRMMKHTFLALKGGDWEEYKSIFRVQAKATEWAFDRIQEADLATTLDASEVYDTTDVGRLTSPLFSQEREVSADPFVPCSPTHSSVEKSRRDVEPFSSFGKPLSKGERNRDLESVLSLVKRSVKRAGDL